MKWWRGRDEMMMGGGREEMGSHSKNIWRTRRWTTYMYMYEWRKRKKRAKTKTDTSTSEWKMMREWVVLQGRWERRSGQELQTHVKHHHNHHFHRWWSSSSYRLFYRLFYWKSRRAERERQKMIRGEMTRDRQLMQIIIPNDYDHHQAAVRRRSLFFFLMSSSSTKNVKISLTVGQVSWYLVCGFLSPPRRNVESGERMSTIWLEIVSKCPLILTPKSVKCISGWIHFFMKSPS